MLFIIDLSLVLLLLLSCLPISKAMTIFNEIDERRINIMRFGVSVKSNEAYTEWRAARDLAFVQNTVYRRNQQDTTNFNSVFQPSGYPSSLQIPRPMGLACNKLANSFHTIFLINVIHLKHLSSIFRRLINELFKTSKSSSIQPRNHTPGHGNISHKIPLQWF